MSETSPVPDLEPVWFTRHVANPAVAALTRAGVSVWGSRALEVTGRQSGEPRRVSVDFPVYGGEHWIATELADDEKPPVWRAYLRRWKAEVGVLVERVSAEAPAPPPRRRAVPPVHRRIVARAGAVVVRAPHARPRARPEAPRRLRPRPDLECGRARLQRGPADSTCPALPGA